MNREDEMQWRGSDDGIVWRPWHLLPSAIDRVPRFNYYQARIFKRGKWETSPIETSEYWRAKI